MKKVHLVLLMLMVNFTIPGNSICQTNPLLLLDSLSGTDGVLVDTVSIHYTLTDTNNNDFIISDFRYSIDSTDWTLLPSNQLLDKGYRFPGNHITRWVTSNQFLGVSVPSLYLSFKLVSSGGPDTWTTKTPMKTKRDALGCCTINDTIYAVGGHEYPGGNFGIVEIYDPNSDSWTYRTDMNTPRCFYAPCAAVNGKLYAIGGYNGSQMLTTVEEYDPATDTWAPKKPLPSPRILYGIAVVNNKIYVIGGSNTYGPNPQNTVFEYDPAGNYWTTKATMPTARSGLACAVVNGKIYAVGGAGGSSTVEIYDPSTDNWSTGKTMPTGRTRLGACAIGTKIYAVGGIGSSLVEEYDVLKGTWQAKSPFTVYRAQFGLTLSRGKIYVIGGGHDHTFYNTVEQYNPSIVASATNYVVSSAFSVNIPDVLPPQHNIYLKVEMISAGESYRLSWSLDSIFSADAESIGIWYKSDAYPQFPNDSSATYISIPSTTDSVLVPNMAPITGFTCFSWAVKDTAGNWSLPVMTSSIHDTILVRGLLDSNDLQATSVSSVADMREGTVYRLQLNGKNITTIPSKTGYFGGLEYFYLANNQLRDLPSTIINLDDLELHTGLDLGNNELTLTGAVRNWANLYDDDWQYTQRNKKNILFFNDKFHTTFKHAFMWKSVLVIEPKDYYVREALYISYTDYGKMYPNNLLEINHFFDLPETCAVTDLWLWMGDSVMQAKMIDKGRAQAIYDSIVNAPVRIDPVILKKDSNHYELSIYPYTSGKIGKIKLECIYPAMRVADTTFAYIPLDMLLLNNSTEKTVSVLFKEQNGITHNPRIPELPGVSFTEAKDTLGAKYLAATIDDITFLDNLTLAYTPDTSDTDSGIIKKMQGYANIIDLMSSPSPDTTTIVELSQQYNILTDFTALLALEPDDNWHFMIDPLDEDKFVAPEIPPTYMNLFNDEPQDTGVPPGSHARDNKPLTVNTELISLSVAPNPFHSMVEVTFRLLKPRFVVCTIYDINGKYVTTLWQGMMAGGFRSITWKGRDYNNRLVKNGTYIVNIEVDGKTYTSKFMLVR